MTVATDIIAIETEVDNLVQNIWHVRHEQVDVVAVQEANQLVDKAKRLQQIAQLLRNIQDKVGP